MYKKSNGQKNEKNLLKLKSHYQTSIEGWKKKIKAISQELEPKHKEIENNRFYPGHPTFN